MLAWPCRSSNHPSHAAWMGLLGRRGAGQGGQRSSVGPKGFSVASSGSGAPRLGTVWRGERRLCLREVQKQTRRAAGRPISSEWPAAGGGLRAPPEINQSIKVPITLRCLSFFLHTGTQAQSAIRTCTGRPPGPPTPAHPLPPPLQSSPRPGVLLFLQPHSAGTRAAWCSVGPASLGGRQKLSVGRGTVPPVSSLCNRGSLPPAHTHLSGLLQATSNNTAGEHHPPARPPS